MARVPLLKDILIRVFWVCVCSAIIAYFSSDTTFIWDVALWTVLLLLQSLLLSKFVSHTLLEGYPRWQYINSSIYQGIILPSLYVLILYTDATTVVHPEAQASSFPADRAVSPLSVWMHMKDFFLVDREDWWHAQCDVHRYHRIALASFAATMVRDFIICQNLEWFFIAHHVTCVYGMAFLLQAPRSCGILVTSAIQAEVCSIFYNLKVLYPSTWMTCVYIFVVGLSNVVGSVGVALGSSFLPDATFELNLWFLMTSLVCLRFAGVFVDVRALLHGTSHPESTTKASPHAVKNRHQQAVRKEPPSQEYEQNLTLKKLR